MVAGQPLAQTVTVALCKHDILHSTEHNRAVLTPELNAGSDVERLRGVDIDNGGVLVGVNEQPHLS